MVKPVSGPSHTPRSPDVSKALPSPENFKLPAHANLKSTEDSHKWEVLCRHSPELRKITGNGPHDLFVALSLSELPAEAKQKLGHVAILALACEISKKFPQ